MSIAFIILGIYLYIWRDYFSKVFILFPSSLSLDNLYSHTLIFMDSTAKAITNSYMTGFLRHYMNYIFVCFVVILGGYLVYLKAFSFSLQGDQSMNIFICIISALFVIE